VRHHVGHDLAEGHLAIHEVVLVAAVAVALAIRVVLVDHDLLALGQERTGGAHGALQDQLGGSVVDHHGVRVGALGRGELGVGVVDVVPSAVGEHRVDEVRLDLGRRGPSHIEAARVLTRVLVLEVPADAGGAGGGADAGQLLDVGVDEHRRRRDRVRLAAPDEDAVLRLDPEHLRERHGPTLPSRSPAAPATTSLILGHCAARMERSGTREAPPSA
jgi:hypothetical protein